MSNENSEWIRRRKRDDEDAMILRAADIIRCRKLEEKKEKCQPLTSPSNEDRKRAVIEKEIATCIKMRLLGLVKRQHLVVHTTDGETRMYVEKSLVIELLDSLIDEYKEQFLCNL